MDGPIFESCCVGVCRLARTAEGVQREVPRGRSPRRRDLVEAVASDQVCSLCPLGRLSLVELLELLPELEAEVDASQERLKACVALLRDRRASWREIGEALEVSRQAAWQRFREPASRK